MDAIKPLLFLAVLPGALVAQSLDGTWQGTLVIPNQNLEIRMAFKIDKDGGTEKGVAYNLAAGRQLNLGEISQQGNAVRIAVPGMGGLYEGKFEADGDSITGTFTQGSNRLA